MLHKTIPEAYLADVTVPDSHTLHCNITEKLQNYTGWKEGFIYGHNN